MTEKIIILKNMTDNELSISDLGLFIEVNESANVNWEEVLELADTNELITFIQDEFIIVNDGSKDLTVLEAQEYLSIEPDLSPYEFIGHNHNKSDVIDFDHDHDSNYYLQSEIDAKIAGVEGYGIIGSVNYITDLDPLYTGNDGDIFIVKQTSGNGGGPTKYQVTTDSALYLPMTITWEDELGHIGQANSSMDPVSGGVFGNCCDFDGNDDYLKFDSNSEFGQGPILSVGGWIKTKRTGTYGIIGRWSDNGDGSGWKIDVHGNKLRFSLDTYDMCGVQFSDSNNLVQNEWIHITMVYNGSHIIMYKNAIEVNRVSAIGEFIDSDNKDLFVGKYISCQNSDNPDKMFDGQMCDLFVHNGIMSQEQIQILVLSELSSYSDEGFYQWKNNEWNFLSHNTGESGSSTSQNHNTLLGLNSGDYQHLTSQEKLDLIDHNHDTEYYTETEIDSFLLTKSQLNHIHDNYQTQSQIDAKIQTIKYSDISSNDPNTNIAGSELEILTNGSNADALHTHISNGNDIQGNGLNDAYDNHSDNQSGLGRTIDVDSGPIIMQASNGHAPLRLSTIDYKPTKELAGGEICYYNGDLFIYDSTRSKWLSSSIIQTTMGRSGNNRYGWMKTCGEISTGSGYGGFVIPWDCTIIGLSINAKNNPTDSFNITLQGSTISTYYWGGNSQNSWDNLNINFNKNERLAIYQDSSGEKPNFPAYTLFIKRRIS